MTRLDHPTVNDFEEQRAKAHFHAVLRDRLNRVRQEDHDDVVLKSDANLNYNDDDELGGRAAIWIKSSDEGVKFAERLIEDFSWTIEPQRVGGSHIKLITNYRTEK